MLSGFAMEQENSLDLSDYSSNKQTSGCDTSSSYVKPNVSDFDFVTPARSSYQKPIDDSMKYTYPNQIMSVYERENWTISMDHCYARPWNWRPETSFLRPTKTLFIPKNVAVKRKSNNPLAPLQDVDEIIDIEGDSEEATPVYDAAKATQLMEECDRYANAAKPNAGDDNWEENISQINWTPSQIRIFDGIVNILNSFYMSKLAQKGVKNEPILRRTIIDKAVQRIRRLMATVVWDVKITQWLHQLLIDNLNKDYLAAYLDILQTLKSKVPSFVEKMIYGPNSSVRLGLLSNESLFPLLKRPWDPVASSLMQDKPKKLPGNPIILVVPSAPTTSKRIHKWITLLSNLATVVTIPMNLGSSGQRITMVHCLDQMFATTRGKIQEIRQDYPGRNIVLVGFNAGATLALQIAQVEPVLSVVCLGFSLLTAEGRRGEADDNLLELQCPVLFVIGQCSNTSLQEDVEDLRERMRVETGLIVVGSADDYLRVNKKKKIAEGITQSVVDRCIVDEIGEFISGVILSPFPPQIRQSPTHATTESPVVLMKKGKVERKRYNSNVSSLDSEPPSPTPRITRPGLNSNSPTNFGRPPGSKTKSKLEAKWAAQIAQGSPSPSSSPPPSTYTPDTSSNDSSLTDNKPPTQQITKIVSKVDQLPLKKIKTLKPVDKTMTLINTQHKPTAAAKLQAYGFNRSVMAGGPISTLLQGGIKTLPPTQTKQQTGIKVLENVTLNSSTTAKLISNNGRTLDLSKITVFNPMNSVKNTGAMGNVILLPDGKIKAMQGSNIKGTTTSTPMILHPRGSPIKHSIHTGLTATTLASKVNRGKYITSKRQLIGNKPPRPMKKVPYLHQANLQTNLPPPTNLTTQDIMDLPIIFADDNQILDGPVPATPEVQHSTPVQVAQPSKIITSTPGNKFVLVNKQMPASGNFIINPGGIKKASPISVNPKPPKYTKIILSKRNSVEEMRSANSSNIITKITSLPSEISVKKVQSTEPVATKVYTLAPADEPIDLENELVATAVPKPNLATSDIKNITVFKHSSEIRAPHMFELPLKRPRDLDVEMDDPDYIPPKNMKLE